MTSSLKLVLVVGTTAVVSGVIGYLVAGYQLSKVWPIAFTDSYLNAASNAAIDVRTLRAIHNNDLTGATSILEARIDSHLLHLSSYNDVIPREWRDASVYADLATVRRYRTEVPSSSDTPEAQAAITKALALKSDQPQRP